jgi:hypothetical protein
MPVLALAGIVCAGCASVKLGPKFAQVREGSSREEVLTFMGTPDATGDIGTVTVLEQWEYSDDNHTYLIRFGAKKDEPREQWKVVGKTSFARRSIAGAFGKVRNGMTRGEVSDLLGPSAKPVSRQAPDPGDPCDPHYTALQTLLKGGIYEEWAYSDAGKTYLVWFGSLASESQEDWRVIGKITYTGDWTTTGEPVTEEPRPRPRRRASSSAEQMTD